ncbi:MULTISPECIES: hypothetical protein [unclassified Sphingobium]|uniref:hypothetical protein n=1 Tax=unclassified Sphingobium TaxID=2611147 RepID=UPI002224DD7E|nr:MULTISPECIES: hypothetical protein [unclassified Sphingobium]MCW2395453.1 hypothetical protein [Sphingobium sp. B8D3B]MCW2418968.1 hypothetical protein [Sphingobium sp. B8D3C]
MQHAKDAGGYLLVAVCCGAVDLENTEHALVAVVVLVEQPAVFDIVRRFNLPGICTFKAKLALV